LECLRSAGSMLIELEPVPVGGVFAATPLMDFLYLLYYSIVLEWPRKLPLSMAVFLLAPAMPCVSPAPVGALERFPTLAAAWDVVACRLERLSKGAAPWFCEGLSIYLKLLDPAPSCYFCRNF